MRIHRKSADWFTRWSRWFAWHPVRVGDDLVWLETVERKGRSVRWGDDDYIVWAYREAEYLDNWI